MTAPPASDSDAGWHVIRAKPKAEHLAAASLARLAGVTPYCPRIRFEKATRRGRVWFVEALFPGYLFARFDPGESLRAVQSSPQVTGAVHFGSGLPALEPALIESMMAEFPPTAPREVAAGIDPEPGDTVEIVEGALAGWTALVRQVLPGRERVRILLDWLGQTREVEVGFRAVVKREGD
ncbi:MAG: hypothetical protein JNK37_13440 [Verrucomicrobiales bacterium]|nr:hypothetical protein [Verrucomicrobiales bacterium]